MTPTISMAAKTNKQRNIKVERLCWPNHSLSGGKDKLSFFVSVRLMAMADTRPTTEKSMAANMTGQGMSPQSKPKAE